MLTCPRLFNFLFSLVTPYMIAAWGSYTFLFYACLDIIMAIFVWFFFKETKGKSLEEIDEIFGDVKIVHEEDVSFSEKAGVDVMERRDSRVVQP